MKKLIGAFASGLLAFSIAVLPAAAEGYKPVSGEPDDEYANIMKGDVNGDGVVDSLDAALILKYDAGLRGNK